MTGKRGILRSWPLASILAFCTLTISAQSTPPSLRQLLDNSDPTAVTLLSDDCLNTKVMPQGNERYIHIGCHINPSAEELFVFSRDRKLKGELYGWELVTLPNDFIVYQDSEVHFAPTHSLGISIFDPSTGSDKKIYPPIPYQPVRQAFIARVAAVYKSRGEEWFREHNHPGDPEMFDTALKGDVKVDANRKAISFTVQYGDPENGNDPLPFSQLVHVTCAPLDSLLQLHCIESAQQ